MLFSLPLCYCVSGFVNRNFRNEIKTAIHRSCPKGGSIGRINVTAILNKSLTQRNSPKDIVRTDLNWRIFVAFLALELRQYIAIYRFCDFPNEELHIAPIKSDNYFAYLCLRYSAYLYKFTEMITRQRILREVNWVFVLCRRLRYPFWSGCNTQFLFSLSADLLMSMYSDSKWSWCEIYADSGAKCVKKWSLLSDFWYFLTFWCTPVRRTK